MKKLIFILLVVIGRNSYAQQLAFPTAEGYGKNTTGGRGGAVYEVTNLNDTGEGSLRAAIEASGARTVVFRVAGTIKSDLTIKNDSITIAGQTAPGDGIAIDGNIKVNANNIIIRYVRIRGFGKDDALGGRHKKNIIIDHVSASWSKDEVMSFYHCDSITIQWSMITEATGGSHAFGGIWGSKHSTYHHNLFAHNISRNPRFASGGGDYNDFRNNVIYNWQHESTYGGELQQPIKASSAHELNKTFNTFSVNMVANYYKPGPGTQPDRKTRICSPWSRNGADDYGNWYLADNYLFGSPEVTADNWKGVFPQSTDIPVDLDAIPGLKLEHATECMPIKQQTAEEAYQAVLKNVGCVFPVRDAIDTRIIEEVRTGTAGKGEDGYVLSPEMAGGWPILKTGPVAVDTDRDGMPDKWEKKNGLNPKNAGDRNNIAEDGYTMLEKYMNSITN
ncbi:MAG: pectate lyase [Bacteroidales bacterium]